MHAPLLRPRAPLATDGALVGGGGGWLSCARGCVCLVVGSTSNTTRAAPLLMRARLPCLLVVGGLLLRAGCTTTRQA